MTPTAPTLPDSIPVPASTAAAFAIIDGDATARDLAFAIGVAHLAAVNGTKDGRIEIPDNLFRAEVGRFGRQSAEREADRLERLAKTVVLLPGGEAPLPTQYFWEAGRAKTLAGGTVWIVDPLIEEAFRVRDGEAVVEFPTYLLRNARSRHSVMLCMKVLAWWAKMIEPRFEVRRRDGHLVIRMSIDELRRELLIGDGVSPSNIVSDILAPAADEVSRFSDHHVEIEMVRTKYRDGRVGKLAYVEIRISALAPDRPMSAFLERVEQLRAVKLHEREVAAHTEADRLVALERGTAKPKTWQRPSRTRPKPPRPAPADVSNVVPMSVDTILSAFVQDPVAVPRPPLRPPVHSADNRGDD